MEPLPIANDILDVAKAGALNLFGQGAVNPASALPLKFVRTIAVLLYGLRSRAQISVVGCVASLLG